MEYEYIYIYILLLFVFRLPFVELESAQDAAAQIIKAQQQDIFERSIPSFWLHLNNWGR